LVNFVAEGLGMYILKIKGTDKIPDYIQIRDKHFALKAYFRADRPDKGIEKAGLLPWKEEITRLIRELPYGKLEKLKLQ